MGLAARDADFARQLWVGTAQECQRAQNHVVILGCLNARQRVGAFLLLLAVRSSGENEIELSMTRRDIGDYLGLTIETVSRTISQFENDDLIGITSTRRIALRDCAELTRIAAHDNSTESYRRICSLSAERVD
jgi:CRP/FNR family transcriptional regulator, nitrogen fixation regulation protein